MENVSSVLALISVLLLIFFGTTIQALKIYKNKSVKDVSFWLFLFSFFAWSSWIWYGWVRKDWLLFWTQTLGAVMTLVILIQFLIYRRS